MATDSAHEFDLGPLSWVQGEIDQALTRGLESLAAVRAAAGRMPTPLKHARTHVHQAAGAIQMVGLDAVVAFTDEIERQLARLEELPPREVPGRRASSSTAPAASSRSSWTSSSTARRRCRSSSSPNTSRCSARAASRPRRRPTSSIPDLGAARAAASRTPQVIPPQQAAVVHGQAAPPLPARPARVAARRRRQGAKTMRDAVAGIEDATTQRQPARVLVDGRRAARRARRAAASNAGFGVKQLAARVDLQIRRVVEGSREGRRPPAPRSALLRRDQRAGRRRRCRRCSARSSSPGSSRRPKC